MLERHSRGDRRPVGALVSRLICSRENLPTQAHLYFLLSTALALPQPCLSPAWALRPGLLHLRPTGCLRSGPGDIQICEALKAGPQNLTSHLSPIVCKKNEIAIGK